MAQKDSGCGCGCGAAVSPGRRYRIGHDAKHKSALLTAATTGRTPAERQKARATIAALGWSGHLAIREAMLAKRAKPAPKAKATAKPRAAKPALAKGEKQAGSDGRTPDLRLRSRPATAREQQTAEALLAAGDRAQA